MKEMYGRFRAGRRQALSLPEVMIATIVLSTAVVAVAAALIAGTQQTYLAVDSRRGVELAQAMMEEISVLPYADPQGATTNGPDAGESARSSFDNVDDYHGYSEAAGAVADHAGTVYPTEYDRFTRSVTVATTSLQPTGFANAVTGVTVVVTVTLDGWTLSTLSCFVPDPDA